MSFIITHTRPEIIADGTGTLTGRTLSFDNTYKGTDRVAALLEWKSEYAGTGIKVRRITPVIDARPVDTRKPTEIPRASFTPAEYRKTA